jgi:dephospho-CoA kinase
MYGTPKVSQDDRGVNDLPMLLLAAMLYAGLTGNIASGKSAAALVFAELGAHVIDADRVAHELYKTGMPVYDGIVAAFGKQILDPGGEIDRQKLGQIVFSDKDRRLQLNALIHPEVGAAIRQRIIKLEETSPRGIIIVDAALMIETGGYKMYHYLIVVACAPSLQVSRLMSRDGVSEADARSRIASQMPIEEKLKLADYIIDTSGTLGHTRSQVEEIYRDLVRQEARLLQGT